MIGDLIFQAIIEYRWTRRTLFALLIFANLYSDNKDKVAIVVVLLIIVAMLDGIEYAFRRRTK